MAGEQQHMPRRLQGGLTTALSLSFKLGAKVNCVWTKSQRQWEPSKDFQKISGLHRFLFRTLGRMHWGRGINPEEVSSVMVGSWTGGAMAVSPGTDGLALSPPRPTWYKVLSAEGCVFLSVLHLRWGG